MQFAKNTVPLPEAFLFSVSNPLINGSSKKWSITLLTRTLFVDEQKPVVFSLLTPQDRGQILHKLFIKTIIN